MAQVPTKEGTISFVNPALDVPCFTYFKVFGDLLCGVPPVVVLHGGPGAGHEYLLPFADLWLRYGIPVIFYDQVGCASSTHLRHTAGNKDVWQLSLFLAELDNVINYFQLQEGIGYHILGQSFGGMLGVDFATRQPKGLRGLILANSIASKELGIRGWWLRRAELPLDVIRILDEGERKQEYEDAAYKNAMAVFSRSFTCRSDPCPPELIVAMKNLSDDKTVQGTMYVIRSLTLSPSSMVLIHSLFDCHVMSLNPPYYAEGLDLFEVIDAYSQRTLLDFFRSIRTNEF